VLAGQKRQRVPAFDSDLIIARFLTVIGMRGHSWESVEMALQLIAGNRHGVQAMSSHTYALHETDRALRSLVGQGDDGMVHMTIDPHRLDATMPGAGDA
jgi:threonine dehydrogenase-like Zn-dependent dehydrogenase